MYNITNLLYFTLHMYNTYKICMTLHTESLLGNFDCRYSTNVLYCDQFIRSLLKCYISGWFIFQVHVYMCMYYILHMDVHSQIYCNSYYIIYVWVYPVAIVSPLRLPHARTYIYILVSMIHPFIWYSSALKWILGKVIICVLFYYLHCLFFQ